MTTLGQIILYSNYFVLFDFLFPSFAKRKRRYKRLGMIKKIIFYQLGLLNQIGKAFYFLLFSFYFIFKNKNK